MKWCKGSGVPGDPISGGHAVPVEWQTVAWRSLPTTYTWLRNRCRLCEQTRRDYIKGLDRELVKARNALASHARRYAKPNRWDCSVGEARRRLIAYGWDIQLIAAMFRDAKAAGVCKECRWPWDYGEHELTLDVSDTDALRVISPDSRCNVTVMCRTCNTRKQSMSLVDWRVFQAYVRACHVGQAEQLTLWPSGLHGSMASQAASAARHPSGSNPTLD
jgi:hypothetical protein